MRSAADTHLEWLESLSPWPEEFGLGRMRELLARLGNPQLGLRAIHVVGTNGKTTTTRMAEALLSAEGLRVGAYTSPHVVSWAERVRVGSGEADLEVALGRVRAEAESVGATQFEALTAAALAEFAAAEVDVAIVEAGLGGRHDATNVLGAEVVVADPDALGERRQVRGQVGAGAQAVRAEHRRGEPHGRRLAVRADDVDRAEGLPRAAQRGEQPAHPLEAEAHAEQLEAEKVLLRPRGAPGHSPSRSSRRAASFARSASTTASGALATKPSLASFFSARAISVSSHARRSSMRTRSVNETRCGER